jgi:mono/diheme cytochrome c family protein
LNDSARKTAINRNAPGFLTTFLVVAAVALAGTSGIATAQKPAVSAKAKHGEEVFKANCIGCHSKEAGDTTPFGPPNLHGVLGKNPVLTPQQATETIKQGKGVMPAFEGKLNDSDINAVVAYLKTL